MPTKGIQNEEQQRRALCRGYYDFKKIEYPLRVFKMTRHPKTKKKMITELMLLPGTEVYTGSVQSKDYPRKMRANRALVLANTDREGQVVDVVTRSDHDPDFKYRPGKTVRPQNQFAYVRDECQSGIHFFISRRQALRY